MWFLFFFNVFFLFFLFSICFWGKLLSQVLKSLEGSQWDDASVDELLAAADESGDGQLQVEELKC